MHKSALITGGAKRIGAIIAQHLARAGYHIAIHYHHSEEKAAETSASIQMIGQKTVMLSADLRETSSLTQLVEKAHETIGPLTLLVNNASEFENDCVPDLNEELWEHHFSTNLKAPVFLSQAFARLLKRENRKGSIINIIDQRVWRPTPQFFSYTLTKSALWTATRTLAQALAPDIRVNAVGPGPTLPSKRQSIDQFIQQNKALLLEKGSSPQDIAEAVLFLAQAESVTGQMIAVDGGQHLAWETPDILGITE